ncbi:hypothetical protein Taro_001029 [Colocasia esculenta]|uniref:Uncharacterized protein n=1 Tax=Colocasia esculenta TaxID=4460 RepID=A0A843TEX2_COLES|nr:hypothetical protein [Colocasia esculenta]
MEINNFQGRVEEFLAAGEAGDPHTKPFFFPVVSAATCTDSHLEVDQSIVSTPVKGVSTLPLQNICVLARGLFADSPRLEISTRILRTNIRCVILGT